MSDKKISQLTELAATDVAPSTDVLVVVDTSATETKKITAKGLVDGALNTQTANGVLYLNGSKVATSGSGLTYDGSTLATTGALTVDGNATLGNASTDTVTVSGRMGIGAAGLSHLGMFVSSSAVLTGQATAVASVRAGGTFGSDVTSDGSAFIGKVNTAAASFTLTNARGLFVDDATKGAGSTITNLYGIYIADQTQGTNNYGITSAVSSGTNKWNIYASGTANNYFAGNVGIGTTSPVGILDVVSSGSGVVRMRSSTGSGTVGFQAQNSDTGTTTLDGTFFGIDASEQGYVYNYENAPLIFGTNSAERMRIDSSGNVGIGTTNPQGRLDLGDGTSAKAITWGGSTGTAQYSTIWTEYASGSLILGAGVKGNTSAANFLYSYTGTYNTSAIELDSFSSDGIKFYTDSSAARTAGTVATMSERMRISQSGNVGIGTTSPSSKLHLSGAATADARLTFTQTTAGLSSQIQQGSTGMAISALGSQAMLLETNGTERMRIDSSGNVGIGVTSVACPLNVEKAAGSGNVVAKFVNTSSGGNGFLLDTTSPTSYVADFRIGNVSQLRLDSAGNLGLGVTPSAWAGNSKTITVSNAVVGRRNNGASIFAHNLYESAADTFTYTQTGVAARMEVPTSGGFTWNVAPSGTAGNAISFTQALTLDANRNLLLNGTTAPASGVGTFAIFNGTAPTGSVTNGCVLYAEDVSSSSELKVRDEAGNVTTLSPHNFSLIPEGASEDMAWAYYSEKGGKRINVDMLKLARMVEKLTGEKLVYEA